MNDCQVMHETIVRDIVDVINDVKDFDQVEWLRNKNGTGSIAKRASNLVLVFPVIVSNSLSIETASIISKAIERKCVSLLQILFSSVQYAQGVENMDDYIKLFHTNLNQRVSFDDFIDTMDRLVDEGAVTITDKDAYDAVMEDMHNINYVLSNEYNPVSINDYRIKKNVYGESYVVQEAKSNGSGKGGNGGKPGKPQGNGGLDAALASRISDLATAAADRSFNRHASRMASATRNLKDETEYFKSQLLPGDVQKANELVPTTMLVNFTSVTDGVKYTTTGVVGVKAKLYPVDAMDIVNRISSKVTDSNSLFNLVRASTREISFFKDLAFAIDKAKVDAINMSRESNNAKIFKLLERRASKNRFSTLLKKNDASPITSLVISQDEVEYLKKYNNLDMEKSYVTRNLLEGYNLMDIVIADESLEVARFLYDDGDGIFETLSFDMLEKESKDGSYKKVLNLMSKMNR